MKILSLLILFTLITACDPHGFGYDHNPAWVLDTAFRAVGNSDQESFLEVSGKEALCLYGNADGISYLKQRLTFDVDQVKINHSIVESKHFKIPEFVGFWSYYTERYKVDVLDKRSGELLLVAIVDCNFGTASEKDEGLENLTPIKYKKKECKLIKVSSSKFEALPISARCEMFRIQL